MDTSLFKYEPLTEADSFRLILLQPSSSHDADLHCSLLNTTLSECDRDIIDQFTALSYVWGDPNAIGHIAIGDSTVTITASLASALRDLRDKSRVLRIWADALCINQNDSAERSSQVSMMDQIYSTAHHTVIHLLPSGKDHQTILRALASNTSGTCSQSLSRQEAINLAEDSILKAQWFSRVWTFQELVLSKDPWVQCGTLRARWSDLCNFLLIGGRQPSPSLQLLSDINGSRGFYRRSLLRHLSSRRGLGATNPVDIIYSHLGLVSDIESLKQNIPISYEISCTEVYESMARYLINNIGPEGPDTFFPHISNNHRSQQTDLASWAPDWSLPSSGLLDMYRDNIISTLQLKKNKEFHVFVGQPLVLGWIGYHVDVVKDISSEFPEATALSPAGREQYQQAATEIAQIYHSGGVWWSGDGFGRYRHVDLRGKEADVQRLGGILAAEWTQIMESDLALVAGDSPESETKSSSSNLSVAFQKWFRSKIDDESILAGSDSDGLLNLLWLYFHPDVDPQVLKGRKLCSTEGGRIAVVPAQTQKGDTVVYLGGMEIALVLREYNVLLKRRPLLEEKLKSRLKEKETPERYQIVGSMDGMKVQGAKIVGEAFVDGVVGWRKSEKNEDRSYAIYALR